MTAKEKASELVQKFYKFGGRYPVTTWGHAKQCAFLHIDEVKNLPRISGVKYEVAYWNKVKQEIEKQ